MAVNLNAIDAKIRKLQKLRDLLADDDTRSLIADPEVMAMLQNAVATNGNSKSHSDTSEGSARTDDELPAEGSLRREVLETARRLPGKFSMRDIYDKMTAAGYKFDAQQPTISINQALTRLEDRGWIKLVRKGTGRYPHIYEFVREEGEK